MKRNWYKFRVKYIKVFDNEKKKKVSEEYLVDAESFTETEKRAIKAATDLFDTNNVDVTAISREVISEILLNKESEDSHWYKSIVALITEDEETEQNKFTPINIYVRAQSIKEADVLLRDHMQDCNIDWEIKSIVETKVLGVLNYKED